MIDSLCWLFIFKVTEPSYSGLGWEVLRDGGRLSFVFNLCFPGYHKVSERNQETTTENLVPNRRTGGGRKYLAAFLEKLPNIFSAAPLSVHTLFTRCVIKILEQQKLQALSPTYLYLASSVVILALVD